MTRYLAPPPPTPDMMRAEAASFFTLSFIGSIGSRERAGCCAVVVDDDGDASSSKLQHFRALTLRRMLILGLFPYKTPLSHPAGD